MQLGQTPVFSSGGFRFGPGRALRNGALVLLGNERGLALDYADNSFAERDMALTIGRATDYVTFSRASDATYIDDSGIMRIAGPNVMRRSRVPETGRMGYLAEWSTTNLWRNSRPSGGAPGVIGSGGVLPSGWTLWAAVGLTVEILAISPTGIEDGVPGVALRIHGTSSGGVFRLQIGAGSFVTIGDTYTTSAYARAVAGSMAGITGTPTVACVNGGPEVVLTSLFAPSRMAQARRWATGQIPNINPESLRWPEFRFISVAGSAIDITVMLGAAQMEQRNFVSSYVPTDAASSAARSADNARVNLSALPWSTEYFCVIADFDHRVMHTQDGRYRSACGISSGAETNYVVHQRRSLATNYIGYGAPHLAAAAAGGVAGQNRVVIAASSDGRARISANGGAVVYGTHEGDLSVMTTLGIAQAVNGLGTLAGHLHSLVLLPRNPTDLEMQGWSTL